MTSPGPSADTTPDASSDVSPPPAVEDVTTPPDAAGRPPRRSAAERIARRMLLVEGADPKALMDLKGSLVISAIRCVLTYAIIPAMTPLISWSGAVATPVAIVLTLLAMGLAINSLRRVWLADWTYRWSYTAFIGLVLLLLGITLVFDVRSLLG
ncbi:MAG: hypothetical protein JJT89_01620 [Nitriliruptoraceae bacterium]|nr:hypothetical protein [Nitriliruptoraceae bacterium]